MAASWHLLACLLALLPLVQFFLTSLVPESPVSLRDPSAPVQKLPLLRRGNLRRLVIGLLIFAAQQFSGINPI
jgi:hypothetical protein